MSFRTKQCLRILNFEQDKFVKYFKTYEIAFYKEILSSFERH